MKFYYCFFNLINFFHIYCKNRFMKSIIIFNLLVITTINPIINAHENHEHQIYSWSNSKNKTIKSDSTIITVLAITIVNPIVNAHENHDHKIYSWSNSKNKSLKIDSVSNGENLEDKKIKTKNNWIKFLGK